MADANDANSAPGVRDSIEAKASLDSDTKDAPDAQQDATVVKQEVPVPAAEVPDTNADVDAEADLDADADADAEADEDPGVDADADADGDVDMDVEGEEDAEGDFEDENGEPTGLSSDMFTIIENTANYLSSYREPDGYQIAQAFQRIPNRRLIPDYYEVIDEAVAFSTIRVRGCAGLHPLEQLANKQYRQRS